MAEKIHVEVPVSYLEYKVIYREPMFDTLLLSKEIPLAGFRAFREWNVALENITYRQNPANLGEVSISFALPGGRMVFTVGLGASLLLVTNPNWGEAESIAKLVKAGVSAVQRAAGVTINQQRASIAMHVLPKAGSIKDLTSNFIRTDSEGLSGAGVKAFGVSVYKEDSIWIVDASASYDNALFVKIERTFSSDVTLEQVAVQLNEEENRVLGLLNLEVD